MRRTALKTFLASSLLTAGVVLTAVDVACASIETYRLHDHPDGAVRPPLYGLRLDNLQGDGRDYTFSFDAVGAEMYLMYNDVLETINISGKAYGGRDIGNVYDTDNSGLWAIDFTYTVGVYEDAGGLKVTPQDPDNKGTIELLSGNWDPTTEKYYLNDYQGGHADSFLFLPDGDRIPGDITTFVGRGWLRHGTSESPDTHYAASDWLFTGDIVPPMGQFPVPEPTTILVWGILGAIGLGLIRPSMS